MANTVTISNIIDTQKHVVTLITIFGDGSGSVDQVIIDPTALTPVAVDLRLLNVKSSSTFAIYSLLQWEGTSNPVAWILQNTGMNNVNFEDIGGLINTAGAGKTGALKLFISTPPASGRCSFLIKCLKVY